MSTPRPVLSRKMSFPIPLASLLNAKGKLFLLFFGWLFLSAGMEQVGEVIRLAETVSKRATWAALLAASAFVAGWMMTEFAEKEQARRYREPLLWTLSMVFALLFVYAYLAGQGTMAKILMMMVPFWISASSFRLSLRKEAQEPDCEELLAD